MGKAKKNSMATEEVMPIEDIVTVEETEASVDENLQNKQILLGYIQNLVNILETKQNEGKLNMFEAYTCYDSCSKINELIKLI